MDYKVKSDVFKNSTFFDSSGRMAHKQDNRFKIFPYTANDNVNEFIDDFGKLLGGFLCIIDKTNASTILPDELVKVLKDKVDIEVGREDLFQSVIYKLFFEENGSFRPLNLKLIEHNALSNTSERKIAQYMADVFGDKDELKQILDKVTADNQKRSNALEQLVLDALEEQKTDSGSFDQKPYFRVTDALKDNFISDYRYILSDPRRSKDYLTDLLEFYFFSFYIYTGISSFGFNHSSFLSILSTLAGATLLISFASVASWYR